MKLVAFKRKSTNSDSTPGLGAVLDDGRSVLDLSRALEARRSGKAAPQDLLAWFDLDGPWLGQARELLRNTSPDDKGLLPLSSLQLLPPVPRPRKIICIGLNYKDHAAESKMEIPRSPIIFSKFPTCVVGPDEAVVLPATSAKVDYEAEMAVVIGRKAKHVPKEDAYHYVLGYTNFNDVSARDFQFADGQWQRGKSCDTFAPMGPYIVMTDEIEDPHGLFIRFRLNGKTLQDSSTSQLIFGVRELIAFLSETITLEPGDVIATGTPPGVGFARTPPVFLQDGDVAEVEVEGLGLLRNPVQGPRA